MMIRVLAGLRRLVVARSSLVSVLQHTSLRSSVSLAGLKNIRFFVTWAYLGYVCSDPLHQFLLTASYSSYNHPVLLHPASLHSLTVLIAALPISLTAPAL